MIFGQFSAHPQHSLQGIRTTETCGEYSDHGRLPSGLMDEVVSSVRKLEKELAKSFGSTTNPLLVSVRSGAAVSMPGMMDTVLNLGLTDKAVLGLGEATGNPRFAWDAYRRLINMFGNVVMGVEHDHFEAAFDRIKKKYGVDLDTDVPSEGLEELCAAYKAVYPRAGRFIGFQEAEIDIDWEARTLRARYIGDHPPNRIMSDGEGHFCFFGEYVLTVFLIPQ